MTRTTPHTDTEEEDVTNTVAVIGGTGRTGRLVVRRLVQQHNVVRAVGRRAGPVRPVAEGASFHRADVRDPATLGSVLSDVDAVVYCVEPGTDDKGPDSPRATMHDGLLNVLAAAGRQPRVVLVSQIQVTHRGHPLDAFGGLLSWRLAGEEVLRRSGLPYTVVRPGWLTDETEGAPGVQLRQGDRAAGSLTRANLAEICVQALRSKNAPGTTFEAFDSPYPSPTTWEQTFGALDPDRVAVA
jgi:uncharacterized protein YbjT (DUF2867 family)